MRSALHNTFLDCPVESYFTPQVVCKLVQTFRTELEIFTGYVKRTLTPFYRSAQHYTTVMDVADSDDGFDWRLNDFAYESESQSHALPHRAWQRHSAVLTLAREVSVQKPVFDSVADCKVQELINCDPVHCNVCDIHRLPVWATSYSDMSLIEYDISIDIH